MKNLDSLLPVSDEGLYPIRTVSEISGVNSITLRAWERRYEIFKPKRSPKGHRLYSEKDIQKIQQVLALLAKGVSIGRVAKILKENHSESDVPDLLAQKSETIIKKDLTSQICIEYKNDILESVRDFDVMRLEGIHHELLSNYSIESIGSKLIIPILNEQFEKGKQIPTLTSYHSFYRVFILYRLGGLCLKTSMHNSGKKLLLMGLENHHCDMEMLLFILPLLQKGFEVICLGCNVSLDSIPMSLSSSNAEGLIIYTNFSGLEVNTVSALAATIKNIKHPIFVTDQTSSTNKNLQHSGVIILPTDTTEQVNIINKIIDKTE